MPSSAIQTFTDPHEYQSAIRANDVAVVLTGSGPFQAKLTRMDLHQLWMRSGESSLPYLMRGTWPKNRSIIHFLTGSDPTGYHNNGLELTPGSILINPVGTEFYRRSTGRQCGSMSLSPDDLAAAGRTILGRELTAPAASQIFRPTPEALARLLRFYEAAEKLAATAPELLAHPEVARAMEQELIRAMVLCMADGELVRNERSSSQRGPVMRRFEQILAENLNEALYVPEICAAVGVPERTLRLYCADRLGMSPHRYLWLRRMHQARRELALADASKTMVTEVATQHGFWELGRFSVEYRQLFGEAPSTTLRRSPHLPHRLDQFPVAGLPV